VCFECEKKAKSIKSKPATAKKTDIKKTGLKRGKKLNKKDLLSSNLAAKHGYCTQQFK
jgi:hypothetical protein